MSSKNLLVELFVEELPPKALKTLGEAFANTLANSLKAQGLASAEAEVTAYASPRRLAVLVADVHEHAADKPVSQKLMPVSVGLDSDGKPTQALLKKLASVGADESAVPKLKRESDGKAESLFFDNVIKGASLKDGLQIALDEAVSKLPIPKVMTYQLDDGWTTVNFVRPAHSLIALHGTEVVPVSILGLAASNLTQGHRFEATKHPVAITAAHSYEKQLQDEGAVIASFEKRREEIRRQLEKAAAKENLKPIDDEDLLDEVTALVERPNVLVGQFEQEYLEVPQECLILTMKANQKYFPLLDGNGRLTNKFLIVSNINPDDPSAVIGGNERVVRPRLADAKFFFDQDRKKTLESRVPGLAKVVYHNKLGTQGERMERVLNIAVAISMQLGGEELAKQAGTAAMLAKADLLTDMVGEFPELQGIMGNYYAKHDGLPVEIADAIEDHYKPRFAGDELPRNQVGVCVALADKLETLIGMFGIGQIPTGDKDPFALRRHALGVVRLLIEKNISIGLRKLVSITHPTFDKVLESWPQETREEFGFNIGVEAEDFLKSALGAFLNDRLANKFKETDSSQNVDAVLALNPELPDIPKRLEAVKSFAELPEAESLAAANKRVGNILKKAEGEIKAEVDKFRLQEHAEIALYESLATVKPKADSAFDKGDYTASLKALAALKTPVDAFFDNVMVNAEDPDLRANRLALLAQLHSAMNRVADLSKLAS